MKKQLFKIPLVFFLFILSIFLYLLVIDRDPSNVPSNLINKKVPLFTTDSLLNNKKFDSSQEFGKEIILVNFFATWCEPCRAEHKYIKNFSTKKKLRIIGINYKDNPEKAAAWLKALGNPYTDIPIDKNGRIAIKWGVYGIPETILVSQDLTILKKYIGPLDLKDVNEIKKIINK